MAATAPILVNCGGLCLASVRLTYWILWGGSLALSVVFIALLWTRWGHSKPLHKCAALSLIVHLILAFLTMTVRIVNGDGDGGGGGGGGAPIHVRLVEQSPSRSAAMMVDDSQIAELVNSASVSKVAEVAPPELMESPPALKEEPKTEPKPEMDVTAKKVEPEPVAKVVEAENAKTKDVLKPDAPKAPDEPKAAPPVVAKQNAADVPVPQTEAARTASQEQVADAPKSAAVGAMVAADITAVDAAVATGGTYALRSAPGRLSLVLGQGGNAETEAAVGAALRWLAANQAKDGRWDAVQFGAGKEEMTLGQNRGGAGHGADTGITALALLAFLGAGQSHLQGEFKDNVRQGLDFLLRSQGADGNLFGDATLYAQMYCHSMSTFALAECQAMTNDRRIEEAVTKAVNYSLVAQNSTTGGWRYRPGDSGDTSQLGWQIMALASAKRAGIKIPEQTWSRVERFLRTVERGQNGGLASYRPDSPASTSMTAEAFYCRLMLQELQGSIVSDSVAAEATAQLLASQPASDRMNLYYWYYATLALHHRQRSNDAAGDAWRKWNGSMTATLTKSQQTAGENAGSWDANQMWGGYGGRIYTTAMATMCLEVYYRYAPAAPRGAGWSASRPQTVR